MAESLCGPSNALQSFKNHSQIDRTLQQDLQTAGRQLPVQVGKQTSDNFQVIGDESFAKDVSAQGFRTPDPRAGSLDAEFAAFTAGPQLQPLQLQQQQPLNHRHALGNRLSESLLPQSNANTEAGWATDFQKLHLRAGPDQRRVVDQSRMEMPVGQLNARSSIGDWHQEFALNQPGLTMGGRLQGQSGTPQVMWPLAGQRHSHYQSVPHFPLTHQQDTPHIGLYQQEDSINQVQQTDQADSAAFEEAFAQAESEHMMRPENIVNINARRDTLETSQKEESVLSGSDYSPWTSTAENTTTRIGSDNIPLSAPATSSMPESSHGRISEQMNKKRQEDSLLAQTAGQLLTSVSHEPSSKFAGSQFLDLMRRIRDREVEVSGEEFLPTKENEMDGPYNTAGTTSSFLEKPYFQENLSRKQYERSSQTATTTTRQDFNQELHPGGSSYPYSADREPGSAQQSVALGQEAIGSGGNLDESHRYDHWASGEIGIGPSENSDPMTVREYYSVPSIKRARERAAEERMDR